MLRAFWLARRRPDLSRQQYMDYYENKHRFLGEEAIRGEALNYIRHYLNPSHPGAPEPVYDCLTEICFPDRASYDRCMQKLIANKELTTRIAEDETKFIDRASVVHYVVENRESPAENLKSRS